MQQLDFFGYVYLSVAEKQQIYKIIRAHYWTVRNSRKWRYGDAPRRKAYRKIEAQKKRLLEAGVSKREVLDLLQCCRLRCKMGKNCPYCI
ncbi:hypothetical protein [Undibacterium curvum]|uniref:hypothetical protein n=1 Tax=Undibacterium curvum TaxID=2762294 RepID=UPI003D0E0C02